MFVINQVKRLDYVACMAGENVIYDTIFFADVVNCVNLICDVNYRFFLFR